MRKKNDKRMESKRINGSQKVIIQEGERRVWYKVKRNDVGFREQCTADLCVWKQYEADGIKQRKLN